MVTFRWIPFGNAWTPLTLKLWFIQDHYCYSKRIDLELNNQNNMIFHHHHHHHVVPLARISLIFSRHFSLSSITFGRSSGLHPVSSHNSCMCVGAGRPPFARPYVGVHRSTSLISSSLLLQQCPACLVRQTWIVFVMGWEADGCIVGALWGVCRQDLFNIARNIRLYGNET